MADYLILKKDPNRSGPRAWAVCNLIKGKTATVEGAGEALTEAYHGPGRYAVLRADGSTVRTVTVATTPKLTIDDTPEF